jgi:hypothetical protein
LLAEDFWGNFIKHRKIISDKNFMRNIYLANNEKLNVLFSQMFPMPRAEIFKGYAVPPVIAKLELESTVVINKILNHTPLAENKIIKMQRNFRGKQRQKNEVMRISNIVMEKDRITNFDVFLMPLNEKEILNSYFLKTISEKHNNAPILIKQGEKYFMFGG